jgi:hypothetical protein
MAKDRLTGMGPRRAIGEDPIPFSRLANTWELSLRITSERRMPASPLQIHRVSNHQMGSASD